MTEYDTIQQFEKKDMAIMTVNTVEIGFDKVRMEEDGTIAFYYNNVTTVKVPHSELTEEQQDFLVKETDGWGNLK